MIYIVFIINLVISWLNAWGSGKMWNESKVVGAGVPRFMLWCALISSASGFTWCYMMIVSLFATNITYQNVALLSSEQITQFQNLGFLLMYFPMTCSGIVMTVYAWVEAWKKKTLTNYGIAAWDTFATINNVSQGIRYIPDTVKSVIKYFIDDDPESDQISKWIVLLLVFLVLCVGIFTTYGIFTNSKAAHEKEILYNNMIKR